MTTPKDTTPAQGDQLTPAPYLIRSRKNRPWTVAQALAEPTDNAFAPGKGEAQNIVITLRKDRLGIRDDGLGIDDINRVFQLGNHGPSVPGDIGLFGVGVTDASIWLADRLEVTTVYQGRLYAHSTSWKHCLEAGVWPTRYTGQGRKAKASERGTDIWFLDLHRTPYPKTLESLLSSLYAPALRNGRTITISDERSADAPDTIEVRAARPSNVALTEIQGEVTTRTGVLRWTGRAGLATGPLSGDQNAVHIGFGHRIVKTTRAPFGGAASNVYVEVDLAEGWAPHLSDHKDEVVGYRDELYASITTQILFLLEQAKRQTESLHIKTLNTNLTTWLRRAMSGNGTSGQSGTATGTVGEGVGPGGPHEHDGTSRPAPKPGPNHATGNEVTPDPVGKGIAPGDGTAATSRRAGDISIAWQEGEFFAPYGGKSLLGTTDLSNGQVVVNLNKANVLLKHYVDAGMTSVVKLTIADIVASAWGDAWVSGDQHAVNHLPVARRMMASLVSQDYTTAQRVAVATLVGGIAFEESSGPQHGSEATREVFGGYVVGEKVIVAVGGKEVQATVSGGHPTKGMVRLSIDPGQDVKQKVVFRAPGKIFEATTLPPDQEVAS
jgi:hypothetical protein